MILKVDALDINFLSGNGEMAMLTRTKDWSKTSLGASDSWPQSLKTTLSILLNSKFPMFLWWGPELTCFYNDAYRPSLGIDGKHPSILGMPAKEAWPEIWDIISPLIERVLTTGEATWAEDQLVPIYRNGKIEDVYWTFSYSPLPDENGKIEGILVTCTETTNKVKAYKKLEESEKRFRETVSQAPMGITIFNGPGFIVEMANDTYLQVVDRPKDKFIGKPLFEVLPEVKEAVEPLLINVLQTGIAYYGREFPVRLHRYGKDELTFFDFVYQPLKDENGIISRIMVVATEVTTAVNAKHELAESENQFRNLVMQSPIPMTIVKGHRHVIDIANTVMYEKIWRIKEEDAVNRSILDVFPELKEQKYPGLLDKVFTTGIAHREKEAIAYVQGSDGLKKFYLDYEYSPLFGTDKKVDGIIITVNDVTEKVEARQKIEENEKQLSIVIEGSELGTWEFNPANDTVVYSERAIEILGYEKNTVLTHDQVVAHVHPADLDIRLNGINEAFETGKLDFQLRIIDKNKEIKWIENKGVVMYDDNHHPVKLLGTMRDITTEKRQHQVLEEREQKFRLLADSMPQMIWTGDAQGNLNYFNQSVYDYSGYNAEQLTNGGWLKIVHPDEQNENVEKWMHSINTGEDFLFQHRFRRYDGEYRWQLSRAVPQRDENGKIQMWVGTSTDIQDQKLFETRLEKLVLDRTKELEDLNIELKKSETRYHLMVEEVQDYAILYLNKEGIVENWNRGAEKIKGYTASEIIGKSFSVFYTQSDRDQNLPFTLLNRALSQGKALQQGWRVRKDGTLFWASVVITAVHNEEGNVIGFSKVTHDLTEKREADEKLKQYANELEQKNKELIAMNTELQSFAYVSSHDLQEPLRKIQVFSTMIKESDGNGLSENGKNYLQRMEKAAARMQTLIQDLLAYSRTNTAERNFEKVSFQKMVGDAMEELKEEIAQKTAKIEITGDGTMNVIAFQFQQLLINLIGNALKFSKPGVAPYIKISCKTETKSLLTADDDSQPEPYFHIAIADNGIGFEPEYKTRIFEVFQRLHGKTEYKGTGIGLAIVKKIVENHKGYITADGEQEKGARFDIYIPVNVQ